MQNLWKFLRPSWVKIIFPSQLLALLIIEVLVDGPAMLAHAYILVPPAVLYYLLACVICANYQQKKTILPRTALAAAVISLGLADQAVKAFLYHSLPPGGTFAVIQDVFHISHTQNHSGPWIFHKAGLPAPGNAILVGIVVVYLVVLLAVYRYYNWRVRRSLFADLTMVFLGGALISAFFDLAVRGFTLDYLALPGIVVADLKDILIWFGISCLLAELISGPFYGRKMSINEFLRGIGDFVRFQFKGPPRAE